MVRIFFSIINWFFNTKGFNDDIKKIGSKIVNSTLEMYKQVSQNYKPTPVKSHYTFNLRDFSRVIFGICLSLPAKIQTPETMTKLWVHEVWRVFSDRMNSEDDRLIL